MWDGSSSGDVTPWPICKRSGIAIKEWPEAWPALEGLIRLR